MLPDTPQYDTVIVPAGKDGFENVFLGENCWHALRLSKQSLTKIKYLAVYQTRPISAITHYARIDHFEPYNKGDKYKAVFSERPQPINPPIALDDAPRGAMMTPRFTTFTQLITAKKLTDLIH